MAENLGQDWKAVRDFLSRLASGETKPKSPWISVEDRLPELNNGKSVKNLVCDGKNKKMAYYFPEHFKTAEWEDWDDYTGEEDFPHTEDDRDNEVVWLRPGFYEPIDCDRCDTSMWAPIKATHWMPLPAPPESLTDKTQTDAG